MMHKDIQQQWFFPYPPHVIWEHLTQPELLAQWLMENDFLPLVGHRFRFITKPIVQFGFDGIVYCEVLEVLPLEKLAYSWKGGPGNGKATLDSVVTWKLTPKENGTELLLEHTGFEGLKNFMGYLSMNLGWKYKIKKRITTLLQQSNGAAS